MALATSNGMKGLWDQITHSHHKIKEEEFSGAGSPIYVIIQTEHFLKVKEPSINNHRQPRLLQTNQDIKVTLLGRDF